MRHEHRHPEPATQREPATRLAPLAHQTMLELFDHLEDSLDLEACDHDMRHTEAFLVGQGLSPAPAINWLRALGAECDCAILETVELTWSAEDESPRFNRSRRGDA